MNEDEEVVVRSSAYDEDNRDSPDDVVPYVALANN